MRVPIVVALLLTAPLCPPQDRAVVAEVYYDAAGDDTGREFVELLNPTSHPVALGGVRLETGDGAGAGRWSLKWTGPAGLVLAAGDRFVLGGARVDPRPDTLLEFSFQNGPDALRLVWPDGVAETVGYGNLVYDEYCCGRPAADVVSGQSLARIPDDAASGDNAADFRAASPSPGQPNLPRRHVSWVPGSLALAPAQPPAGGPVVVTGRVTGEGAEPAPAGTLAVALSIVRDGAVEPRARGTVPQSVAPGETLAITLPATAPEAGVHVWRATLELADDGSLAGLADSLVARTGLGPLVLTEIQFHPAFGEGEWVEARNRSGAALDVAGWTLADRGGSHGAAGAARVPADSFIVFAQHRDLLIAARPGLDSTRIVPVAGWPSLNNRDGADGVADGIALADPAGVPVDRAEYSATDVPAGVPVEPGSDGRWRAALEPDGTPLAAPREPASIAGAFALLRPRVPAGEHATRIAWSLPWRAARVRVDAFDLAGDRVAALLGDTPVAGRGERDVDVAALGPGLYVVQLDARADTGAGTLRAARTLRVGGRTP